MENSSGWGSRGAWVLISSVFAGRERERRRKEGKQRGNVASAEVVGSWAGNDRGGKNSEVN